MQNNYYYALLGKCIYSAGINYKWNNFVYSIAKQWKATIINWVIEGKKIGRIILVVYYEDIQKDRGSQTKRMLDFLGVEYHQLKVTDNVSKFRRKKNFTFDPFTPKQRKFVVLIIKRTIRIIKHYKMSQYINLDRYLSL